MEIAASRLLYDNIHDFKTTAMHVDSASRHEFLRLAGWTLMDESGPK